MTKRRRSESHDPFGVDIGKHLMTVKQEFAVGTKSHHLQNYIESFQQGLPVFQHSRDILSIENIVGIFATLTGKKERMPVAALHTNHTVSLYAMAHRIKAALHTLSTVVLQDDKSNTFKTVMIRNSRQHRSHPEVVLGAVHQGQPVVLKSTIEPQKQLKYILEAVIHYYIAAKCPQFFPKLHFIGFTQDDSLVLCSEQLSSISVTSFMRRRELTDHDVWKMLRDVCQALVEIQQKIKFTHRFCHISNVYYGDSVHFIDFDWSCLQQRGRKISVPQYLYDTTRTQYCHNKSVDCCVFLRTLGPAANKFTVFMNKVYTPLMLRYEEQSKQFMRKESIHDSAALQLYKMSTCNKTMRGHYSHSHGLNRHPLVFEYMMGTYEWSSMTPQAILHFLELHKV
jgi:hypothetical protein